MKERPILFSSPMVRAILEGRKTMTRRVVKKHPLIEAGFTDEFIKLPDNHVIDDCPYGVPGDRLWVKETWTGTWCYETMHLHYAADGSERMLDIPDVPHDYELPQAALNPGKFVSPLFMPRWASRITLEITGVRVERVQDISPEDARAEGLPATIELGTSRGQFMNLWDSINAARGYGWDANPWVCVVEFKRVEGQ